MANQLRWDPVEVPRLDTRDLALAGQAVNSGFDRFAQLLQLRDERLNKKATDAGAMVFANAQTPEELAAARAQLAAGAFGERADGLQIANAANQRQEALLKNAATQQGLDIGNETLLDARAMAEFGDEGQVFVGLMNEGKRDQAQAFANEQAARNPELWARVAYGFGKDGEARFGDHRTFAQNQLEGNSRMRNDDARTGIAQQEASERSADRKAGEQAYQVATRIATENRVDSADVAAGKAQNADWFKALPAKTQIAAMALVEPIHKRLNTETPEAKAATAEVRGEVYNANRMAEQEANRRKQALMTPEVAALAKANDPKNPATIETVIERAHSNDSNIFTNGTRNAISKVITDVAGNPALKGPDGKVKTVTPAMLDAAMDLTTPTNGFGETDVNRYYAELGANLVKIATVDNRGDPANVAAQQGYIDDSLKNQKDSGQAKVDAALRGALARQAKGETLAPTSYNPNSSQKLTGLMKDEMEELQALQAKSIRDIQSNGPRMSAAESQRMEALIKKSNSSS